MKPRFVERSAFEMVGFARTVTPESVAEIPAHWQVYGPRLATLPAADPQACYGMSFEHRSGEDGGPSMRYMAGVEGRPGAALPEGAERVAVPAARCAVFTFDDHIGKIGAFIEAVWREHLPAAGLARVDGGFDFERYDTRWNPETGEGPVDYHVAVAWL